VVPSTGASECMRQHLTDSLEFLADFHSLSKIKVELEYFRSKTLKFYCVLISDSY